MKFLLCRSFKQIYYIAMVGYGNAFAGGQLLPGERKYLVYVLHYDLDPALIMSCLYSRSVYFGEYAYGSRYVGGLRLSAAHASESGGNKCVAL